MQKGSVGIAVALIVFFLLAVGAYVWSTRSGEEERKADKQEDVAPAKSDSMAPDSTKSEKETDGQARASYRGAFLAGSVAPLLDFTKTDYEEARQSGKLVVLYFYAAWCSICKKETADALYPAFNELTDERVIGFRVNYNDGDTDSDEKALAREFGVGYQHTKVFLKNGERLLKSPEGWDKARYLTEITKAL